MILEDTRSVLQLTHDYSCLLVLFSFILQLSFSTALCKSLMCVYHVNKRLLTYLLTYFLNQKLPMPMLLLVPD